MVAMHMKVVKQRGGMQLVRILELYYVVHHDPVTNTTSAVHRADMEKGSPPRAVDGFTANAVKTVARGRKLTTADNYFKEACRAVERGLGHGWSWSGGKKLNF